jgi:hypothetical protein
MNNNGHDPNMEKKILTHDPVKGYRPAFYICFVLGVLYLTVILAKTL